jgi:DNA polymerase-4
MTKPIGGGPSALREGGDGVPVRARDLMLVDLDAFYVSVEQRKDPGLLGKPVIVGGVPGERGVVASASYEARAYGVHAGMPLGQAAALCPRAVFLHGDHADYAAASAEVLSILGEFAPRVEPVSLDEAFLDLSGCERLHRVGEPGGPATWLDVAETLHRAVRARAGLSVSIGVGGTRAVAAVAAALAKPAGALEVPRGEEAAFLAGLPVERLPGVGPKTREALARFNLHTIGDLARLPEALLEETFGKVGVARSRRARGIEADAVVSGVVSTVVSGETLAGDDLVRDGRPRPKSISRETSFAEDTADRAVVGGMLSYLAQRAAAALRREGMSCRSVGVRLRYADFETVEARRRLRDGCDRDRPILDAVAALWPQRWTRRVRLRLVGVALFDLAVVRERQGELFPYAGCESSHAGCSASARSSEGDSVPTSALAGPREQRPKKDLDAVLDGLRERHGFGVVMKGRAIDCLARLGNDPRGFRLRTPSCSA